MAAERRFRRAASARAERAEPVDAGAEHRRGPDRRDVPHLDHEVVDAERLSSRSCGPCTRRSSAASRCRIWRGAGRWRRSAPTPSRSPTAWTSRRSHRRPCWTGIRARANRCCSSVATTSRARAWPCCWAPCRRWSTRFPDIEILIVGRGDEDAAAREAGTQAGHLRFLGQVDDAGEGLCDAQRRRVLRAEYRRRELRHRARRGDGRGHRGGGQ